MEYFITLAFSLVSVLALTVGLFYSVRLRKYKVESEKYERELKRQMYELEVLKQTGDRAGYSLDHKKIVDVIIGSLGQLIDYSVVSYMLVEPEVYLFKASLNKPVSRHFIEQIKLKMTASLSALLGIPIEPNRIEEAMTGALIIEDESLQVRSFFNIPLAIGSRIVGILTVSHTKSGLYQKEEEMTILYKIVKEALESLSRLTNVINQEQYKLNSMLESMTEGVIMTDVDYRIKVINPIAISALQLSNQNGYTIFDVINGFKGTIDIKGALEEGIVSEKQISVEVNVNNAYYQVYVGPVEGKNKRGEKEIIGGVIILHDQTEIKQAQKMREDFTSMMVHDLRSPLDGISKATELILQDDSMRTDAKTHHEYMTMINDASKNMLGLVSDLLDAAKLDAGKFEMNMEEANMISLIKERIFFYQPSAKKAEIKLESVLGKDVPDSIMFDPVRITQVYNNVISNALKFTPKGGAVVAQVLLHNKDKNIVKEAAAAGIVWRVTGNEKELVNLNTSIICAVTDSGMGISEADVSNLFNKFKQAASATKTKQRGTGLGLVISKGIVEAHGGVIGVVSKEGEGSTFYFTIPVLSQAKESSAV